MKGRVTLAFVAEVGNFTPLDITEVARLFKCSESTVLRRVRKGTIPAPIKIGGATRWYTHELRKVLGEKMDFEVVAIRRLPKEARE